MGLPMASVAKTSLHTFGRVHAKGIASLPTTRCCHILEDLVLKRPEVVTARGWTISSAKPCTEFKLSLAFKFSRRLHPVNAAASLSTAGSCQIPSPSQDASTADICPRNSAPRFPWRPVIRVLLPAVVLWAFHAVLTGQAVAASHSVGKLSLGQKVASFLRGSQWSDEAIVFVVSMLPVLELRGAIPVGYWMGMDPLKCVSLAVLGNTVPVPFILLYLGKLAEFMTKRSQTAARFFEWLFEHTRKKAGPVEEFKWLGLMLFVAVPLPGTGAWSGAIVAYILGMPFWEAFWANFCGVTFAGFIMSLLCSMGLREALVSGVVLFLVSTFIWSFLRFFQRRIRNKK